MTSWNIKICIKIPTIVTNLEIKCTWGDVFAGTDEKFSETEEHISGSDRKRVVKKSVCETFGSLMDCKEDRNLERYI